MLYVPASYIIKTKNEKSCYFDPYGFVRFCISRASQNASNRLGLKAQAPF